MLNKSKLIEEIVREVVIQLGKEWTVPEAPSKPMLFVHNADQETVRRLEEKWEVINEPFVKVQDAVLLEVSQNVLVKGALGLADDPDSALLAELLLQEVSVTLIPIADLKWLLKPDGRKSPYQRHLLTYKAKLESFGVRFTSLKDFVRDEECANSSQVHKKLVTEQDVRDSPNSVIFIGKSTIVTPLARDAARELGKTITIVEYGER